METGRTIKSLPLRGRCFSAHLFFISSVRSSTVPSSPAGLKDPSRDLLVTSDCSEKYAWRKARRTFEML